MPEKSFAITGKRIACRALRIFTAGALLWLPLTSGTAGAAASANEVWRVYVDAAAASCGDRKDYAAAVSLLKAAMTVAGSSDSDSRHVSLTRFILLYAYVREHKFDLAEATMKSGEKFDPASLGEGFLPLVGALDRLAGDADRAANELEVKTSMSTDDQGEVNLLKSFAASFAKLETVIYRQAKPEGSPEEATALVVYGIMLRDEGKYAESNQPFREALDVWKKLDSQEAQYASGDRRLTLFQERILTRSALSNSVFNAMADMGRNYVDLGKNAKQADEREGDFHQAESIYKQAISRMESIWPNHPWLADRYLDLGEMYEAEGHDVEAEQIYRHSLQMFTAAEGPKSDRTISAVTDLVNFLRRTNRVAEAAALETAYGIQKTTNN
jgi:tetratricopeptide (TPR) repeat protein